MLIPLAWLREFTPYDGSAEKLGDRLTMLGLELEDIVHPFESINSIVTGYVAECVPHPDSDHLHCCKVDVGEASLLDIVCGAPNVAAGQKVPVAKVGSSLPDGTVIKKAKLRGQPSFGMICSERELGFSDDHSGIMILPESVKVGMPLVNVLNLDREVLDFSVTPNRPDCLSVLGVARETAMAFNLPFNVPDLPLEFGARDQRAPLGIQIDDPELCWLYAGRIIRNVTCAPSPLRIRLRLRAVDIRPISNVVDVTNYILLECGQPLHSFDLDRIRGKTIGVRPAKRGETLTTLDGKDRQLAENDLCICDASGPIALAGIMGGQNTEITLASRNIFLESAVFRPQTIRKTARRLGISTEASFRFERGVDQERSIWAMDRACALITSFSGGDTQKDISLAEPRPFRPVYMDFRPKRASAILGVELRNDFSLATLRSLGCPVENEECPSWRVEQPSWRPDLTREIDLIEEVGRIYGLDTLPPSLPAVRKKMAEAGNSLSLFEFCQRIKHWGAGLGLNEVVNYSFVGAGELDRLNIPSDGRISIMNPLSEEQNVLRTCIAPGLLNSLRNNLAQGCPGVHIFEVANVFTASDASETSARETSRLGILLYGMRNDSGWPHGDHVMGYADIKGVLQNLLHFLNLDLQECRLANDHPFLSPCVEIHAGNMAIGEMGSLNPDMRSAFHAQREVWLAELNISDLLALHEAAQTKFVELPVYPPVRRDMTVICPYSVMTGDIVKNILAAAPNWLEKITLVDCFEPDGGTEKNLTFRMTFRHASRTLKDSEVDREREKTAAYLVSHMPVKI